MKTITSATAQAAAPQPQTACEHCTQAQAAAADAEARAAKAEAAFEFERSRRLRFEGEVQICEHIRKRMQAARAHVRELRQLGGMSERDAKQLLKFLAPEPLW